MKLKRNAIGSVIRFITWKFITSRRKASTLTWVSDVSDLAVWLWTNGL